ncbi:UDP-glycosyltransferase 83A1-like [Carya illinoinensis]|uniref:UDP-glycosyltransferase 83A1-like n=1 Tax=Carya illinoinensis TaxID=32201 RepID=A0A8T1R290_CARIL|nr:UDP-glycosyltransferase 83A1-like [Carya illinoinensis]KAG6660201.1 hypothetical protein CIPAW_03G089100 [Carya illinoinensis]
MGNPHVLVIPFPAQGHIIPLLELSRHLVNHGFKITFVNTEYNHDRIMNAIGVKDKIGDQIHMVTIPDGIETLEDRKKPGKSSAAVLNFMPGKLEELIDRISGSNGEEITCVLADQSIGWALEIAEKKGIRRAAFCPAAAALLVLVFNIPNLIRDGIIADDGTPLKKQTIRLSPEMPAVNTEKLLWVSPGNLPMQKNIFELVVRNIKSVKVAEWLLCNSTYDLEPAAFTLAKNILPIGPLLASNQLRDSVGNFWTEDATCLNWLDRQPPHSVIYVAFGSFTIFDPTQFQELALGLELCNRPFLWVVRPDTTDGTNDAYPKGFHDRVGTRGQMVGSVAQQKILSHPSVACFLSHCGWNSTIEGVSNGIPFLCWPYFADQFLNQNYICDVWKVGLGLDRDESGIIRRGEIKTKVEQLLGDETLKVRALDLKKLVMASIKEGGASDNNLKNFIEWMKA